MLNLEKAPETGTMYALFTDRMLYQKYHKSTLSFDPADEEKLLELHLFDSSREYRCVRTRMHGLQEYVITDAFAHDDTYEEKVYVSGSNVDRQDNLKERAVVVNYIVYDENDLLHITNYRLKEAAE